MIPRLIYVFEIIEFSFQSIKKQRISLTNRFLNESPNFLKENEKLLIALHAAELELIKRFPFKVINHYQNMEGFY